MPLELKRGRLPQPCTRGLLAAVLFALLAFLPVQVAAQTQSPATQQADTSGPPRTMAEFFQRWTRMPGTEPVAPQAEPAPAPAVQAKRAPRRASRSKTRKSRSRAAKRIKAAPPVQQEVEEPAQTAAPDAPAVTDWPDAETHANTYDLTPFEVKTVREMVEAEVAELEAATQAAVIEAPASPVTAQGETLLDPQDLSPLDMASADAAQALPVRASTDGRGGGQADTDDSLPPVSLSAFAQDLENPSMTYWLEAMLLMLAGAMAGFAAWRFFAFR